MGPGNDRDLNVGITGLWKSRLRKGSSVRVEREEKRSRGADAAATGAGSWEIGAGYRKCQRHFYCPPIML